MKRAMGSAGVKDGRLSPVSRAGSFGLRLILGLAPQAICLHLLRRFLTIPAVTHVDGTARVQTVTRETNPLYREIIEAFRKRTGCPVIVNTSFNVNGEPIVCTSADSYRCFIRTGMDYLVLDLQD